MTPDLPRSVGRALVSLGLLALLVVGLPLVLMRAAHARLGGPAPWSGLDPTAWSAGGLADVLSSRLVESTVVDVLIRVCLAVVWIALVVLIASVLAEVVHRIRHDGIGMPSIRGLGWGQPIARFIATGLLVIGPWFGTSRVSAAPSLPTLGPSPVVAVVDTPESTVGTRALPAVHGAFQDAPSPARVAPASTSTSTTASTTAYTVVPGDSVYAIAERIAASGAADTVAIAERILDLNLGAEMPDGQRFTNAAYIEPGWILQVPVIGAVVATAPDVPASAHPDTPRSVLSHEVGEGDTLSSIAAEHLGRSDRWPEVWQLNAGRDMPDGRVFDDPHLILPGWSLDVPDDAVVDDAVVDDAVVDDAAVDGAVVDDTVVDDTVVEAAVSEPAVGEPVPEQPVPEQPGADEPAVDGGAAEQAADDEAASDQPATHEPGAAAPSVTASSTTNPGTTTSSTAVGGPGDLDATGDERGTGTPVTSPSSVGLGQAALLSAGAVLLIGSLRRRRLREARPGARVPEPRPEPAEVERSLRSLDGAERLARIDLALRSVAGQVAERDRQVLAVFATADGTVEVVTTAPCELAPPWEGRAQRWMLPASVSLEALAADARSVGAPCPALVQLGVALDGRELYVDLEAIGTLEISAAASAADRVLVGLAATLGCSPFAEVARLFSAGIPERAFLGHPHHETATSAREAVELGHAAIGGTAEQTESTFALRARMIGGEAWEPAVVLVGSDEVVPPDLARLVRPGRGLAIVAACPPASPADERPDAGDASAGDTGVGDTDAGARLELHGDRWLLTLRSPGVVSGAGPLEPVEVHPVGLDDHDIEQLGDLVEQASRPVDEPPAVVDTTEPCRRGDESVIDDVDEHDGGPLGHTTAAPPTPPWSIMVRVLGPVEVVDADGNQASFEKSKTRELIAWLVTHRDRPTRTAARTALWELDVRDVTFANVVSAARRTMGRLVPPPADQEWLARTQTEQLPVHPHVVTDADLLRDRLEVSRSLPHADAVEVLGPAVDLIRGMPFEGTSYLWPDADGLTSNLVLLATSAAAELAAHHLALGDVDGVFRATGRGLSALPGHEELIALRMRAHARAGDHAGVRHEWESYERVITSDPWSDGEPAPKLVELRRELLSPPA